MPQEPVTPADPPALGHRRTRLGVTVGAHTVTDVISFVVVPLMPLLRSEVDLSNREVAIILGISPVASGAIQPVVAYLSDRWNTRVLGTLGLVLACTSVSLIGYARSFETLLALQFLAMLGVGAFHPPAAAVTGALAGRKRSLGLAIFFVAGMLGGVLGNVISPIYVRTVGAAFETDAGLPDYELGLKALAAIVVPGLAAAFCLARATHDVPHRAHDAHDAHATLPRGERAQRWRAVMLLYAGNVIRFTTNNALIYLYIRWIERFVARGAELETWTALPEKLAAEASAMNGPLQASMQVGMGGAGLCAGYFLRTHHEKLALIAAPLLGACAIALFPHAEALREPMGDWGALGAALAISAVGGVGFGGLIPVTLSLAQRLLPHRTSLASGLMLGGAWCFAFVGPLSCESLERRIGLESTFLVVAGFLALSAVLGMFVPSKLIHRVAPVTGA